MFYSIALIAYVLDLFFGEFEKLKFIKHPIILIGNYISWFQKKFYKDSILRGAFLNNIYNTSSICNHILFITN